MLESHTNDSAYLRHQYATSANLDARIALHQKYSTASRHFHDWLFDHVTFSPNARVLEVGCGSGALWQRVHSRVPGDAQLTLSDMSFGMVKQARANLESLLPNLTLLQCDTQQLPFADASFDVVFANHMLYHVPDLARGVGEIRRVLEPGGQLYAATNGLAHMRELAELVTAVTQSPPVDSPERIFGLENGTALLSPFFESVKCVIQENNLRVTDVEPLVAYVESGWLYNAVTSEDGPGHEFRRRVRDEIDARGAFHITKAVGLFVAG